MRKIKVYKIVLMTFAAVSIFQFVSPSAKASETIIKSEIAGSWYPADANQLKKQIEELFQKAEGKPIDNVIALILPHAGYQYSGPTATAAIKSINCKYKRVIVIGPSHQFPMEDFFAVPKAAAFQTPLGRIPIDTEFVDNLLKYEQFKNLPQVLQIEHSVQIELPLLQNRFGDFKLVPIVAGQCSLTTISKAANILKGLIDQDTLIIASSDFTHYGASYGYVPFKDNIPAKIKELDMGAYKYIEQPDYEAFIKYIQKTGATICGYIPISVLVAMLEKDSKVQLINYQTSGQLTNDYSTSVSYLGIAISGRWREGFKIASPSPVQGLSEKDKTNLLKLARNTILFYLKNKRVPLTAELKIEITRPMEQIQAAFVTLNKNKELRGCIGEILPTQTLYKSVMANAINAAVNDYRFKPVALSECNDITIEISALTTPKSIASYKDIRIGTDGIILQKNGKSAVFLPQVAPEQKWGIEETLNNLSVKAGLAPQDWKQGASFFVFQAIVFGEKE